MTYDEAMAEAVSRWGFAAMAKDRPWNTPRYTVGREGQWFYDVRGEGDTWEECFEDVDRWWKE